MSHGPPGRPYCRRHLSVQNQRQQRPHQQEGDEGNISHHRDYFCWAQLGSPAGVVARNITQGRRPARVSGCGCATIMSVGRCSVKMSVHEDIDIDGNGTEAVTGIGRCVGRSVKGDRSLWFDGSERAPRMATTGSIQKGRSCCLSPNPPKDTDGRREESGRGVRELQGK